MGRALLVAFVALLVIGVLPASAQSRAPRRDLIPDPAPQHEEQLSGADFVRPLAEGGKNPTLVSSLVEAGRQARDLGRAAGLRHAQSAGIDVRDERVRVEIQSEGANVQAVEAAVARAGGTVELSAGGQVQALVPPVGLEQVASTPGVQHVAPARRLVPNVVVGQEVATSGGTGWHTGGAAGGGVKIAVLDGDFEGYEARITSGDLPQGVKTQNFCSDGFASGLDDGHGTAVAEIVYEMAPGAQLYLVCAGTLTEMISAIDYLIAQGVKIVNHSRGIVNTSRADGVYNTSDAAFLPESLITKAYNGGILWVNSAGNSAATHWAGAFSDTDGDGVHNFTASDEGNNLKISAGGTTSISLKWDTWPTTSEDFDLYLSNAATGQVLAFSVNEQNGSSSAAPTEDLFYRNTTGADLNVFVSIVRFRATTSPQFDLFVEGNVSVPQYVVAAGSLSDFAVSPRALVVGAACWNTPTTIEPYSSRGPTINPSGTGVKPDITGLDSVSNGTFGAFSACGTSGFAGTSAAAPHVAAAAALVKDVNTSFTHDQIKNSLKSSQVTDRGDAGVDNTFGAGVLMMGTLSAPAVSCTTANRAQVNVSTSKQATSLSTTVTASGSSNTVLRVVFGSGGSLVNAKLGFPDGRTGITAATTYYTPYNSTTSFTFTTQRQTQGQNIMVPFVAVDRCGEWKSFVGGGASATGF